MLTGTKTGPRKLTAFVVAVASTALFCALWAGVASAGRNASGTGTIELCKAGDNGATGTTFHFIVKPLPVGMSAGDEVAVAGGSCQSFNVQPNFNGQVKITEDSSNPGGWTVANITGTDLNGDDVTEGSANLRRGSVLVDLDQAGDDTVTYTNQQAASSLKICKLSTDFPGEQVSFTVGQQTVTAVAGSSAGTGTCSALLPEQIGSRIRVTENVPNGQKVTAITYGGSASGSATSGAVTRVTVGAGINIVTYEDEAVGPAQTGFIEVCKDAYDNYVNGTFHFEITDTAGNNLDVHADNSTGEDVLVGQCTGPIQVPAETVVVTESPNKSTQLQSVWANPASDLGLVNLNNQTANVVVPVAANTTGEVQVHFVNQTLTATLKVCKFLTGGSDLAGQKFTFTVTDDQILDGNGNPVKLTVSVIANASANGACTILTDQWGHPILFPIGSNVKAVEDLSGFPFVSGDNGAPGANDVQKTTIVGGINNISFTNQALGQLEICKDVVGDDALVPFTISYKQVGGSAKGSVTVASGACSMPQIVPVGNYVISETIPTVTLFNGAKIPAYQFVASDARGPLLDNRCVPTQSGVPLAHGPLASIQWLNSLAEGPGSITNCGLPFTVSVPYFSSTDPVNFGETDVEIWNKVVLAQLKICKNITSDSTAALSSLTFTFTYKVNGNTYGPVNVKAGTCSGLLTDGSLLGFPVVSGVDGHGNLVPSVVSVTETGSNSTGTCSINGVAQPAVFHVDQVTLTGGSPANPNVQTTNGNFGGPGLNGKIPYTVFFNPGPGPNVVTFWDQSNQCD